MSINIDRCIKNQHWSTCARWSQKSFSFDHRSSLIIGFHFVFKIMHFSIDQYWYLWSISIPIINDDQYWSLIIIDDLLLHIDQYWSLFVLSDTTKCEPNVSAMWVQMCATLRSQKWPQFELFAVTTCQKTYKHTDKQTNKRTNIQTNKQTKKQTYKQEYKQTNAQTTKQTNWQKTYKQTDRKTVALITRKVLTVRCRATSRFVHNDLAGVLGYVGTSEMAQSTLNTKKSF